MASTDVAGLLAAGWLLHFIFLKFCWFLKFCCCSHHSPHRVATDAASTAAYGIYLVCYNIAVAVAHRTTADAATSTAACCRCHHHRHLTVNLREFKFVVAVIVRDNCAVALLLLFCRKWLLVAFKINFSCSCWPFSIVTSRNTALFSIPLLLLIAVVLAVLLPMLVLLFLVVSPQQSLHQSVQLCKSYINTVRFSYRTT